MGLVILGLIIGLIAAVGYREAISVLNSDLAIEAKPSIGTTILAFVVPVLVFTLFASTTSVGTGQIAVMTRFGKVTGQELGEGIHLKAPFDKANKYDVRVQKEDADAAAASKDLQDVNAKLVINYYLERGKVSEIHKTVGDKYKEKLIDPAVQEVFKASTAEFNATQLITDRTEVKGKAYEAISERLGKYGIVVQDLSITNFNFSAEFSNSIEAKQVAAQDAETAKFKLERSRTDAEAQNVQKASLSPELLQKMAIDKWNGVLPNTVSGGGGTILSIPLTK